MVLTSLAYLLRFGPYSTDSPVSKCSCFARVSLSLSSLALFMCVLCIKAQVGYTCVHYLYLFSGYL